MTKVQLLNLLIALCACFLMSCKGPTSPIPQVNQDDFKQYWFQDKAEISSYALIQSGQGNTHDGKAILIFVTEDFNTTKHVKPGPSDLMTKDAVPILKLNTLKEFITGISKYSAMSSVYTPIDREVFPHSLKLTASTQDWHGQTYTQANWKGNRYEIQKMSYLETEGDSKATLSNTMLEDEIWTIIRIAPNTLPLGEVKMMASPLYLRMTHQPDKVYKVNASLVSNCGSYTYTLSYPELSRTLEIDFEEIFPHKIRGWKEVYGDHQMTTASLLNTIQTDYWNHNAEVDKVLRTDLDLE